MNDVSVYRWSVRLRLAVLLVMLWVLGGVRVPSVKAQESCAESRLQAGGQAQVIGTANRLRDAPSTSANRIGEVPPNVAFTVLEIGACEGDIRWIRVDLNGQQGWTAESSGGEFYIQAIDAQAATTDESLFRALELPSGYRSVAWASDSNTLAVLAPSGIDLYTVSAELSTSARRLVDGDFTRVLFSPTQPNVLFASRSTQDFAVFDTASGATLYRASGPEREIYGNEAAFDLRPQPARFIPDGRQLHYQTVDEQVVVDTASWQVLERIVFTDTLRAQVFISPDLRWQVTTVTLLFTPTADDVRVALLDRASGQGQMLARGGALSQIDRVAFSEDSRYLTAYAQDGSAHVWDLSATPFDRQDFTREQVQDGVALAPYTQTLKGGYYTVNRLNAANFAQQKREIVLLDTGLNEVARIERGSARIPFGGIMSPDGRVLLLLERSDGLLLARTEDVMSAGLIVRESPPNQNTLDLREVTLRCGADTTGLARYTEFRVIGDLPARIRAIPDLDAPQIGAIAPDAIFRTFGQPLCINGITWVEATNEDGSDYGWVVEALGGEFLLEALDVRDARRNSRPSTVSRVYWPTQDTLIAFTDLGYLLLPAQSRDFTPDDPVAVWSLGRASADVPNNLIADPFNPQRFYFHTGYTFGAVDLATRETFGLFSLSSVSDASYITDLVPSSVAPNVFYLVAIDPLAVYRANLTDGQFQEISRVTPPSGVGDNYLVARAAVSPDGRYVAYGVLAYGEQGETRTITLMDLNDGTSQAVFTNERISGEVNWLPRLKFTAEGVLLAQLNGILNTTLGWRVTDGQPVADAAFNDRIMSPDGRAYLTFTSRGDGTSIRLFEFGSNTPLGTITLPPLGLEP